MKDSWIPGTHNRKERRKNSDRRKNNNRRKNDMQMQVENDVIFNTKEACDYLKVSRPTLLKYIHSGEIKAKKIGNAWKIYKSELDRFAKDI